MSDPSKLRHIPAPCNHRPLDARVWLRGARRALRARGLSRAVGVAALSGYTDLVRLRCGARELTLTPDEIAPVVEWIAAGEWALDAALPVEEFRRARWDSTYRWTARAQCVAEAQERGR